jgi:hypothetical protein
MRVTRRTRPSQVGCGASAARRRLLHAQANDFPPGLESRGPGSMADLSMVTQLDLFDASETPARPARQTKSDSLEDLVLVTAGSRARGG